MLNTLILFEEEDHNHLAPGKFIIRGPEKKIIKFISKDELAKLFGGYVIWDKPTTLSLSMQDRAIGV